jgi:hypothetical protein
MAKLSYCLHADDSFRLGFAWLERRMVKKVVRSLHCGQRITLTTNCVNCLLFTRTINPSAPHEEQAILRMVESPTVGSSWSMIS